MYPLFQLVPFANFHLVTPPPWKSLVKNECVEYPGILHGILSVPQNNVMDLNNVMYIRNP